MPQPHPERAMLFMAIATLTLPGIDTIAKFLAGSIEAGQVTWARFVFQTLLLLPFLWRLPPAVRSPKLWVHAVRGTLLAVATLCFFGALKFMPIADTISIFFVEPLLLTLLSAWFLKEQVGWRRISAVGVGLAGSALVIQPQFATLGTTALLPLAAAACFSVYLLLTRKYSAHDDPITMQFFAGVFGCVGMSIALLIGDPLGIEPLAIEWPTAMEWSLLFLLGVIATAGHLLMVSAFGLADASLLAPFQYLELVSATILGYWLFSDFPDVSTWLGVAIIVSSGLYVFHRERVLGLKQADIPA
ncbi:MAG: DMT family transporter [Pseudomonadota bacterium]